MTPINDGSEQSDRTMSVILDQPPNAFKSPYRGMSPALNMKPSTSRISGKSRQQANSVTSPSRQKRGPKNISIKTKRGIKTVRPKEMKRVGKGMNSTIQIGRSSQETLKTMTRVPNGGLQSSYLNTI